MYNGFNKNIIRIAKDVKYIINNPLKIYIINMIKII